MLRPGSAHTGPIVDMDRRRTAMGVFRDYVSIISGPVYRGSALPKLRGAHLFGDFTGKRMGAVRHCAGETSKVTDILKNADPNQPDYPQFQAAQGQATFNELTAIVEDDAGELYFVANRSTLLKVVAGK